MRRYAPLSHEHDPPAATAWADVIGKPTEFTPAAHTHPWADLTGFATNTWMNDSEGNPRLFFQTSAVGTNGVILRGSRPDHKLQFRTSANTIVWEVAHTGQLDIGTVPWARLGGWTNNTWLNDAASSPRLYLGTGDTVFGEVRRLSHASQRYIFRDVSDGDRFTIENNGNTTLNSSGTSVWLRLQNAGVTRAYFYTDSSTKFGLLNAVGAWAVRWDQSGAMEVGTVPANLITGSHTRLQSDGLSTSWNVTSGVNTGAFNAVMGTGSSATWLWSGTSGGTFRAGFQVLDGGSSARLYVGTHLYNFDGGNFTFPGTLNGGTVPWARLSGVPALDTWSATTVTQAEAEAGTATTRRAWTAQRVEQAAKRAPAPVPAALAANRTLGASDRGAVIYKTSTSAFTLTTNNTNFRIGDMCLIQNRGTAGNITVALGASQIIHWFRGNGTTPTTGARTIGIGGTATLIKVAANNWHIFGGGIS